MSLGTGEGFKEYAQKWRDLAGRVQPPLTDRELVDMFLGTLSGPFFNHLIGSSSAGFTELILTGERVEVGIQSGKIHKYTSSSSLKKPFTSKKEANAIYKTFCLFGRQPSAHPRFPPPVASLHPGCTISDRNL